MILGLSAPGFAQDGTPDPSFGSSGIVRFGIAGSDGLQGRDIAVTATGQVLALATLDMNGYRHMALCRFQPSGLIDPGFGEGGVLHVGPEGMDVDAAGFVVMPDGRITMAASVEDDEQQGILVARLGTDGFLDNDFGTNGTTLIWPTFGRSYTAGDITLVADGEVVVGGSCSTDDGDTQALLMRFKPNGSLDLTFGTDGLALHGLGEMGGGWFEERIHGVTYDAASNTIWATGECMIPNAPGQRGYKLKTDALGGMVTFQGPYFGWGGGPSYATDLALDASGRVVIIGTSGSGQISYVQCDADGAAEHDGSAWFDDLGYPDSEGRAVAVDWNGRILLAGTVIGPDGERHYALERMVGDCEPDEEFGEDGQIVTPVGLDGWAEACAIALQPNGAIVLLGTAHSSGKEELGLVRLLAPLGVGISPDLGPTAALEIFPNPATDLFSLRFEGDGSPANIELVDALGRVVVRSSRNRGDTQGNVVHALALPSGTVPGQYVVRLTDDRGVRTGRVLVQ